MHKRRHILEDATEFMFRVQTPETYQNYDVRRVTKSGDHFGKTCYSERFAPCGCIHVIPDGACHIGVTIFCEDHAKVCRCDECEAEAVAEAPHA